MLFRSSKRLIEVIINWIDRQSWDDPSDKNIVRRYEPNTLIFHPYNEKGEELSPYIIHKIHQYCEFKDVVMYIL